MAQLTSLFVFLGIFVFFASAYFEVDIREIEQIGDRSYIDYSKLKIRRDPITRTRKVYGNVTTYIELDNTFEAVGRIFIKQGGQFRATPYRLAPMKLCSFLNNDKFFYPELAAVTDFTVPFTCPLPVGVLGWYGYSISLKGFPIVIFSSGEYAVELQILKNGKVYLRWRMLLGVVQV